MATISARYKRTQDLERRYKSPNVDYNPAEALRLVSGFKKKAERRLKIFYEESKRMDQKFPELVAKAASLGVRITKLSLNAVDEEYLINYRKKTKTLRFDVEASRDAYTLRGQLTISPASMRLELNCPKLDNVRTKSGFMLPLFKITYYRTLNVRDNYLASLVGGGKNALNENAELLF